MQAHTQENTLQEPSESLSSGEQERVTLTISFPYWEEKIVSAYAKDERLQDILEQADSIGERIVRVCVRTKIEGLGVSEEELGQALAHAACLHLGKRWLSGRLHISASQAQSLLNDYYKIFKNTSRWLRSFGWEETQRMVKMIKDRLFNESLKKCLNLLPQGWVRQGLYSFSIPAYADKIQAEKFFHHLFDREIWVEDSLLKLPVSVDF